MPPEQVMDTVNIYSIPGQRRKLSLRFLSWFLLKKDIQTSTHDSIEDARYALLLYKLYRDFEAQGRFEDVMEDIFVEGQKLVGCCLSDCRCELTCQGLQTSPRSYSLAGSDTASETGSEPAQLPASLRAECDAPTTAKLAWRFVGTRSRPRYTRIYTPFAP